MRSTVSDSVDVMKKLDGISDQDVLFMYRRVVCYWETHEKPSFRITTGGFLEYCCDKKIQLKAVKKKAMAVVSVRPSNDWAQYVIYYHDASSQPASLLKRLRNATAHCNMAKKKIGRRWFYCFTDYDGAGNCTMVAKIGNPNLRQFVEHLLQTRI